ncbi:MAG: MATE family efflux transporter [Steroidobacter sp.]
MQFNYGPVQYERGRFVCTDDADFSGYNAGMNSDRHSLQTLPAQRIDERGKPHVDINAVFALVLPLIANSSIQIALNLTDTWFVGRISTNALAGMAAIHWLVVVVIGVFGGVGMAVQTVAAQAQGGRRYKRAAQSAWTSLWAALFTLPLFVLIAFSCAHFLDLFQLRPDINELAMQFWRPRMLGAALAIALWGVLGFFNGIGRPRTTLVINLITLTINAVLAQLFIFKLHLGIAGAAWATNCATLMGLLIAISVFLFSDACHKYGSRLMWRLNARRLYEQFKLGLPMGLMLAADLFGFALFQLMIVKFSAVDGAATQIAMMLTSLAYMPGVGIALAGTTLVGQAIGAGDKAWARKLGNFIITMAMIYMGTIGILLGIAGPWLLPLFITSQDVMAANVVHVGSVILWLAAIYQVFDAMSLGSSFCLRGAGDATVPAILVTSCSWLIFVPLTYMLSFQPGQGWVNWLPQFGLGAIGGWSAAVIYICLIGSIMLLRWRSKAWERMVIR